ncbi:DUF2911 domain-containing protein [Rhodohalobacter mucosus]|uniref:DUF2911 domain-containing protein n=1 Tax=Rhodohalobacter mucosus TaxID=2079485 RepID=A0A316TLS7_9BACT|nr:DUF2911 domain-containing protein [Rhodohalobacter mucosus]PWN05527.1 hypothetical protein DDZ15_13045 [Rhodohalobacter mucosus]
MKLLNVLPVLFFLLFTSCSSGSDSPADEDMQSQTEMSEADTTDEQEVLSPPREVSAEIGNTEITIDYSAPSVRERVIWGELVPYNEIWVSGAHMATSIEFENDVLVDGNQVPAGKYAFFTIPGEEDWTVILNENWDQHQAGEYDEALDVTRITVVPSESEFTEQLAYSVVPQTDNSGVIELVWEELKISVPVSVNR